MSKAQWGHGYNKGSNEAYSNVNRHNIAAFYEGQIQEIDWIIEGLAGIIIGADIDQKLYLSRAIHKLCVLSNGISAKKPTEVSP